MTDSNNMPGHHARRFQQIAVAVFHAEVAQTGHDLTPVQYAALTVIEAHPGTDQVTLGGLIAIDRATITGVIDRLTQKGLVLRVANRNDRRVRELKITSDGTALLADVRPAVEAAQRVMLQGLAPDEAVEFMRLLRKVVTSNSDLSRAPLREKSTENGKA